MANWKKVRHRRRFRKRFSIAPDSVKNSRRLVNLARFAFLGVVILFIGSFLILPLMAFNLPSPDKVVRREGFSTKIMDRNGEALYDIFAEQKRTPTELSNIPQDLKNATIAIEDKNFYTHQGFDPAGMLRGFTRIFTRGYAQGGSTLTQQLVKNVLLTPERSVWRKVREFVLAIQIERKYSKDEILQMYLNEAPYGGTAWGVESASETYFGKSVKDLDLIESAILAGLPQRPSVYSPYSSEPEAYKNRTKQVLRRMRDDGYINKDQDEQALKDLENVKFQEKGASFKAPHFVQYVQKILEERYGERVVELGGLRVTTTLDLDLQEKAQDIVKEEIDKVKNLKISNGAAVVLDPQTGEILAMIGSRGFNDPDIDGQVNVTVSLNQPGSAIKPITYVTAFKKGYSPATLLMDTPTEFPGGTGQPTYNPVNYDGKFRGNIQVRYALGNSVNIPAVKMLSMVGVKDMLITAYDLGLTTLEPNKETLSRVGLAVTLGGGDVRLLELTGAYASFMNWGFRIDPIALLKVEDSNGKVLEQVRPDKGRRVLTPEQAYLIFDVLSDNEARTAVFGPNSQLFIPGRQVAVKTGTTNDRRDNWTIGGNQYGVVGVWVGNNDNTEMLQVASGVTGASPIWRKIILEVLNGKPNTSIEVPGGIVTAAIDSISGNAAHDGFPSRIEKFIAGTEPTDDKVHVKLKVCKSDSKLATPSDIAAGNYDEKEYFVFKEEDPVSKDGMNRWQAGIDSWLAGQSENKYHPPSEYCGTQNPVNVEFINPKEHNSNLPNTFNIKISADSTNDIVQIELEVDDNKVRTFIKPPYEHQVDLANGVYTLRAKARDSSGKESDRKITIGVGVNWDSILSPTPGLTANP
ncbi:MAG: Penicillin-binding protein [Candidatus Woesebacteria bacterium GW2011_GWB1_38_8]|uniref:Penicillin-binding protein n=1 Tax=Candidatus Woesebacteria bacterium GW2011_GWB1_38_8 TaxID=1618570 RepID=A0A0G0LD78_9BACT|nr:MAG: Penicillin-binding protein [Candidatus Woesebacteria bacterium GW2011_GWB1_38_8]